MNHLAPTRVFEFLKLSRQRVSPPSEKIGRIAFAACSMFQRDINHRAFEQGSRIIQNALIAQA